MTIWADKASRGQERVPQSRGRHPHPDRGGSTEDLLEGGEGEGHGAEVAGKVHTEETVCVHERSQVAQSMVVKTPGIGGTQASMPVPDPPGRGGAVSGQLLNLFKSVSSSVKCGWS